MRSRTTKHGADLTPLRATGDSGHGSAPASVRAQLIVAQHCSPYYAPLAGCRRTLCYPLSGASFTLSGIAGPAGGGAERAVPERGRPQVPGGPHSGDRLVGRWDSSGHGLLREYSRELAGVSFNSCRCNRGRYQPCVSGGPVVSPTSSCADRRTVRGLSAGSTMRSRSRFAAIVPISRAG